jgi:hypothetical protein
VVSGIGYGVATITATANGKAASAEMVVMAPPIVGAYSVLDLTPVPPSTSMFTYLNDSGHVLSAGLLYRAGVGAPVPGCRAIALNNRSHVLCAVDEATNFKRYAIWRDGVISSAFPADTFTAAAFSAYVLNDSDVVAGLYFKPAFSNPNCLGSPGRCFVLWKDGQPTFPGQYDTQGHDILLLNNRLDLVVEYPANYDILATGNPFLYPSGGERRMLQGMAQAINNQGWAALALVITIHGTNAYTAYVAMLYRPDATITLGSGAATGINDAGAVVGRLDVGPFLRESDGVALLTHAATDPGWTFTDALRINNRGQILAQGSHVDGRTGHWVVLTPVAH